MKIRTKADLNYVDRIAADSEQKLSNYSSTSIARNPMLSAVIRHCQVYLCMKKIFYFFVSTISLILFAKFKVNATTIVIIVTPQSVILGADSRGSFYDYVTLKEEKKSVTKIYKADQYYFAIAGLTNNPNTTFDVSQIINRHLKTQNDILIAIDSIKSNLRRLLKLELQSQKKQNNEMFLRTIESSNIVLSLGIIGITNSKPFAHLIGFQIQDTSTLNIKVLDDSCPGNCPNGVKVFWMGQADAISKYMQQPDSFHISTVILVDKLINLEIHDKPQYVGGPVDIVEITIEKIIWHRRKDDCPIVLK